MDNGHAWSIPDAKRYRPSPCAPPILPMYTCRAAGCVRRCGPVPLSVYCLYSQLGRGVTGVESAALRGTQLLLRPMLHRHTHTATTAVAHATHRR